MPQYTAHYRLGTRLATEEYSASVDRERMTTIENQFVALGNLIGDGRLTGWVAAYTGGTISLSPGHGIAGKHAIRTAAPSVASVSADGQFSLYLVRRTGEAEGYSDFSGKVGFEVVDVTPPATPGAITILTATKAQVTLDWTRASDAFSYRIYRATSNDSGGWAAAVLVGQISRLSAFADNTVSEGQTYYYRTTALDPSGNESSPSAVKTVATQSDLSTPDEPLGLALYPSDGVIQAEWLLSPSTVVSTYEVSATKLDALGSPVGSPVVTTVNAPARTALLAGLSNGARYRVSVVAISRHNIRSSGISADASPRSVGNVSEITSVSLTPVWDNTNVSLQVTWVSGSTPGVQHRVTLTESGQVSSTFQFGAVTAARLTYIGVTANGTTISRRLRESTEYSVRVQALSSTGAITAGLTATIKVPKYTLPEPVTALAMQVVDGNRLEATWRSPVGIYDMVLISLDRTDTTDNTTETLLTDEDAGKAMKFRVPGFGAVLDSSYVLTAVAVDSSGNRSPETTVTIDTGTNDYLPDGVTSLSAKNGLGYALISWAIPDGSFPSQLKVWRTSETRPTPQSFSLLATLQPETMSFADYSVTPGTQYLYAVTTIDQFGQESEGPATGSFSMNWVAVTPKSVTLLSKPANVVGSLTGSTYTLTWADDGEAFDGYQILRAVNSYDFQPVGAVGRDVQTFTDTGLVLKNGDKYMYAVRKVQNGADLFAAVAGDAIPEESLFVGTVTIDGSTVIVDDSGVTDIKDLVDPVTEATKRRLAEHRHAFISDSDDRRISLDDTLTVTDWVTSDSYIFTTATELPENGTATVYVNGVQTSLLYNLQNATGVLTFEEPLDLDAVVSVIIQDVPETQGVLPGTRITDVKAVNVDRGVVRSAVLQPPSHDGRGWAKAVPVTTAMTPDDRSRTRFETVGLLNRPLATCFYDFASTSDGWALAATSGGVMLSKDRGVSFANVCPTIQPVTRLLVTTAGASYAAACSAIYVADAGTAAWRALSGTDGIGFVRDLCQDPSGRVYASTDVGVFALDASVAEKQWRRCAPPDRWTTNCGAVFYEPSLTSVVVSTDAGLFYSADAGQSWSVWSAWDQPRRANDHVRAGNTSFLLTEDRLYRRMSSDSSYAQVALFNGRCRGLTLWEGRLYVSTEEGILASAGNLDGTFSFAPILPQIAQAGRPKAVTGMGVVGDRLLLGVDNDVFVSTYHGGGAVQYSQHLAIVPSVYVNGALRTLGVFVTRNEAYFDDAPSVSDDVQWTTDYSAYQIDGGGWADIDYLASTLVRVDGRTINNPAFTSTTTSVLPSALVLPTVDASVADVEAFNRLSPQIVETITEAQGTSTTTEDFARLLSLLIELEQYVDDSVIIPKPQASAVLRSTSTSTFAVGVVDLVLGTLRVPTESGISLTKYSDVRVAVRGISVSETGTNTHSQIDDAIEKRLSGTDAATALVHQANAVKADLFIEREYTGERDSDSPAYKTVLAAGCETRWYDTFHSTADYILRFRKLPTSVSVGYAACAIYVPTTGQVWAGGVGGVVAMIEDSGELEVTGVLPDGLGTVSAMLADDTVVRVATSDGLWVVTLVDLSYAKDGATNWPTGVRSLEMVNGQLFAGAVDGVYVRRVTEWEKVLAGSEMRLKYFGDLMMAVDSETGEVFSSPSGEGWTSKGTPFEGRQVSAVAKLGGIFVGTDSGLFEDGRTFYAKEMALRAVNVTGNEGDEPCVNDIAVDGDDMVVALSDGRYFAYAAGSGPGFVQHDAGATLGTIHRVVIADGKPWLFGFDRVLVADAGLVARMSTGRRFTWHI